MRTGAGNNGNTNDCVTTVTVEDVTPPIVACRDLTVQLDASGAATITSTDVDDGSTDPCGVTLTIARASFGVPDVGPNPVTLSATDPSGHT